MSPTLAFIGLIEHTNFVEPERYGGRRFLYVSNYLPHGHELLGRSLDEVLDRYEPGLRAVNPGFERAWVRDAWLFRVAVRRMAAGRGRSTPGRVIAVPRRLTCVPPRDRWATGPGAVVVAPPRGWAGQGG